MDETSATLRRMPEWSQRRTRVIAHGMSQLLKRQAHEASASAPLPSSPSSALAPAGTSGTRFVNVGDLVDPPSASGIMAAVTSFACAAVAPRCLFLCGQNGVLLRSSDRCRSWRPLALCLDAQAEHVDPEPAAAAGEVAMGASEPDGDDDSRLHELLGLVSPSIPTGPADAAAEGKPDLFDLDCFGDQFVATVGHNGFAAVSADRGQRFSVLPPPDLLRDRTNSPSRFVPIMGCCLFASDFAAKSPTHILFFVAARAFYCRLNISGTSVSFGPVTVLATNHHRGGVGMVRRVALPLASGAQTSAAVISTASALHFTRDGETVAFTIPHQGGTVRDVALLPTAPPEAVRQAESDAARMAALQEDRRSKDERPKEGAPHKRDFSYSVFATLPAGVEALQSSGTARSTTALRHVLTMLIMGGDGPVVPFDFTALLSVFSAPAEEGSGPQMLVSMAQLQHTPLVSSGPLDRVGVAAYALASGPSPKVTLVRSSRGGVSVSQDAGASWSPPMHAYCGRVCVPPTCPGRAALALPPVAIVAGSKQCCIIANTGFAATATKGSKQSGAPYEVIPVPAEHRARMIYGIAALW